MDLARLRIPELFQGLDDEELRLVASTAEEKTIPAETVLFEEDAVGDDLWLVLQGLLEVRIRLPGAEQAMGIAHIRADETLGELALIDGHRRSAAARTLIPTTLLRFERTTLLRIADQHPRIGYVVMHNLARIVARRLRDTNFALRTTLAEQNRLLSCVL